MGHSQFDDASRERAAWNVGNEAADKAGNAETPVYRNLWDHIGKAMQKKGAGKSGELDPFPIPAQLQTALISLYSH